MNLRSFLLSCISIGFIIKIAHPSALLFGDYPYPTEPTKES